MNDKLTWLRAWVSAAAWAGSVPAWAQGGDPVAAAHVALKDIWAEYHLEVVVIAGGMAFLAVLALALLERNRRLVQRNKTLELQRQHSVIEQRERARMRVLEQTARNEKLDVILQSILEELAQEHPCMGAAVLLPSRDRSRLVTRGSTGLSAQVLPLLESIKDTDSPGPGAQAYLQNREVVVSEFLPAADVAPWSQLLRSSGWRSCRAMPIRRADGVALGVGVFVWGNEGPRSALDEQVVAQVLSLCAIAVKHQLTARQLNLASSVFEHASEGIMMTDAQGMIVDVNQAFERITGYARDEVLGQSPALLASGRHDAAFYKTMWGAVAANGHWSGEIWNRRKNGEVFPETLTISRVTDETGSAHHYVGLFSDVSSQKANEEKLARLAHYDALTGLPNRLLLSDRLSQAQRQAKDAGQTVMVGYIDLDGVKDINDRYGHARVDSLLVTIAQRMQTVLRDTDTLARVGGDEFVVVLTGRVSMADYLGKMTRMLEVIAEPIRQPGLAEPVLLTASMGLTHYPQMAEVAPEQLLRQADQAMYEAKLAGKNGWHLFDADRHSQLMGQHKSISRIQQALQRDEFSLVYQPQICLRSGAVVGAEALVRWNHPESGLLNPGHFLPLIESHALGLSLGHWVIDAALAQQQQWFSQGLQLPVSVNISAHQMLQLDFVGRLRASMARAQAMGHAPKLELEVLETMALGDLDAVSRLMRECEAFGVRFALDDFGTGYSSLTYLRRLPARVVKIDRSFVMDSLREVKDRTILKGVIDLAHAFGRQTVAEGVETLEHSRLLLELGCDVAQGYGIARPMPGEDVPAWLSQGADLPGMSVSAAW